MSLADEIRHMDDEELAKFLVWSVPDECEDCEYFDSGCALKCPYERRTERMLEILEIGDADETCD